MTDDDDLAVGARLRAAAPGTLRPDARPPPTSGMHGLWSSRDQVLRTGALHRAQVVLENGNVGPRVGLFLYSPDRTVKRHPSLLHGIAEEVRDFLTEQDASLGPTERARSSPSLRSLWDAVLITAPWPARTLVPPALSYGRVAWMVRTSIFPIDAPELWEGPVWIAVTDDTAAVVPAAHTQSGATSAPLR